MKHIFILSVALFFMTATASAQTARWQQRVMYKMDIDVDVATNKFVGKQQLKYFNNSPDKLTQVFYHLYWNAFQPNSSMDVRSRELGKIMINGRPDWDSRVRDRISKLTPDQQGYQKIISIKMNGVEQPFTITETILQVHLKTPIQPNSSVVIDMVFEAQVPLQIRRSGRDNPTTEVQYSMSQWYPKMCEYDYEGWHPTPYVAREFYGVWGDFAVNIKIDAAYKLGATGILANAAQIGWGYDGVPNSPLKKSITAKREWKFVAQNVHDFVWVADTAYQHLVTKAVDGTVFHTIFKTKANNTQWDAAWKEVATAAPATLPFLNQQFGKYAYPQFSFLHGGDGGMEYPMATLLAGPGIGTAFHEFLHSWYQGMLGTNESLYAWMDEGFTEYATNLALNFYDQTYRRVKWQESNNTAAIKRLDSLSNILPKYHYENYNSYIYITKTNLEEPLTTHADHFNTNFAYSLGSYSKGCVFLAQLGYIVGQETLQKILLNYYAQWRFKHPNAQDFINVAEQTSGIKLDWYKQYFVATTKTINYSIDSVWETNEGTQLRLKRIGLMPMPIDVAITDTQGAMANYNIPLNIMFGTKQVDSNTTYNTQQPWLWTHPTYTLLIKKPLDAIRKIEIDPTQRLADVDRKNNVLQINW